MNFLVALMAKGKKIYHRNDLRQSLSALSLPPRRILWLILAQQEKDENGVIVFNPDKKYVIRAKDYAELCGIDESNAYRQLKDGVRDIRTHLMEIPESQLLSEDEFRERKRPKDGIVLFTVANHGYYSDGDGYIEVQLDPIMAPFVSKLRNDFTGQFLLSALRIADSNANKLYLLIREWIGKGFYKYIDIDVTELKEKLLVGDSKTYEEHKHFKRLMFDKAASKVVELTEFTSIDMKILRREGRKASKVRISYEFDGQKELQRAKDNTDHHTFGEPDKDIPPGFRG